jgi:hypothetical protein
LFRKTASGILLFLLLVSTLTLAFNIQLAKTSDSLSVDVSPKTGPPGTRVWITLQNPQPRPDDESVRLIFYFNNVIVGNYTYPVRSSSWSTAFLVPDVEPEEYTIKVLVVDSNATGTATFTVLPAPPPPKAGVKAGDWIKYDYTVTGWPAGQPYPLWLKVEFLSVEETNATTQVTMHMSDGTEQNATVPVDVVAGGQALGLSGFIIPANWTAGYSINIGGAGFTFSVTIAGETTRTYAGASRTVVYASFSQYGTQLTYYWDKWTGVMVEASTTSGTMTGTGKATETNMWQATPAFPIDPTLLCILIAIVVATVGAIFLTRRKKKLPESPKPEA